MVWVVGDNSETGIAAPEAAAYAAAAAIAPGSRTAEEQAVVTQVDAKYKEPALEAKDLLTFATTLQADLTRVVRQHAGPGKETAQTEMMSVLAQRLVEMQQLILNLRSRVTALGG